MEREAFQDSPRRSPFVTHSSNSPIRSVHAEMGVESLASQMDFGHRTADFFDDTTEDESIDNAERAWVEDSGGIALGQPLRVGSKKRRSGHYLGSTFGQFNSQCGDKSYGTHLPFLHNSSVGSSFDGSVDELTPSRPQRSNQHLRNQLQHHSQLRNLSSKEPDGDSPILGKRATNADKIMGIHAVHALTLQALLQGGEDDGQTHPARYRSASAPAKKVSMVPPPIDTTATHHLMPELIVRTPYPVQQSRRKEFGFSPNTATSTPAEASTIESIVTLSIRRSNANSRVRISTITIPANNDFSRALKSGSTSEKEKHFAGLDFDDMEFFRQLNVHYQKMLGPYRYLGARSLTQITVSGSGSRGDDSECGWFLEPRSPRFLASRGLSDTFSEDKLLQHFQKPKKGKARYAWVSWAHRLAASPSSPAAPPLPTETTPSAGSGGRSVLRTSMIRRLDQHGGIEFIVSWSAKRILAILLTVLVVSVAAALLWIFLGTSFHAAVNVQGGGIGGAGDRAAAGAAIGIGVLLLGLTGMSGWIGLSWLVM